jgi:3-dehydroquinate synthase
MDITYKIQEQNFITTINQNTNSFSVDSKPRPYTVEFIKDSNNFSWLTNEISSQSKPLILIDKHVNNALLPHLNLNQYPCFEVEAIETNKDITNVLEVCDFLNKNGANRGSMLYVIGGGIIQDLGAFAGYMYKRGIPWCLVPTTLLAQADSCLGGKTAVNHNNTKNVLGLFSAPRKVFIDPEFIPTLSFADRMSGGGEIFRLLVTGGEDSFKYYNQYVDDFVAGSTEAIMNLTIGSLSVKQAIVEYDEFEIDIRRSMNYGHSIGHALEALTNYVIPHGQGVAIGILVENRISLYRNMISAEQEDAIYKAGRKIITDNIWNMFTQIDPAKLLPFLSNDKKVVGNTLKLATLQSLGHMKFIDLPLNDSGIMEVEKAIKSIV